jgi:hypothetical protein
MVAEVLVPFGSALLGGFLALAGSVSTNRFTRWTSELAGQREIVANILVGVRGVPLHAVNVHNLARQGAQFHSGQQNRQRLLDPANDFGKQSEKQLQQIVQARLRVSDPDTLQALSEVQDSIIHLRDWVIEAVKNATKSTPQMPDPTSLDLLTAALNDAAGSLESAAIAHMRLRPPVNWQIWR